MYAEHSRNTRALVGGLVQGDVHRGITNLRKTLRVFESAVRLCIRPAYGFHSTGSSVTPLRQLG